MLKRTDSYLSQVTNYCRFEFPPSTYLLLKGHVKNCLVARNQSGDACELIPIFFQNWVMTHLPHLIMSSSIQQNSDYQVSELRMARGISFHQYLELD